MRCLVTALLLVAWSGGCIEVERPGGVGAGGDNTAPLASAGTGAAYRVGTTVPLDGSGSFDPDGDALTYRWELTQAPSGSAASLADTGAPSAELALETTGKYVVTLTVEDPAGASDASQVVLRAEAIGIQVQAGADVDTLVETAVPLTGAVQTEDGSPFDVAWEVLEAPEGAYPVLIGAGTLTPTFRADVSGAYRLRLTAAADGQTAYDDVAIRATVDQLVLDVNVVYAEYSQALDRFVLATHGPSAVHVLDPESGDDASLALPATARGLSLSPDGLRAAISHDEGVTIVDLDGAALVATHPVSSTIIGRVLYGPGDRVHVAGADQFGFSALYTIDVATGDETAADISDAVLLRLNPVRTSSAYGARGSVSSYEIAHVNVGTDPVSDVRMGPDDSSPLCNRLWFTDDGASFISGCGHVYRSSTDVDVDMTHQDQLPGTGTVHWVDHAPGRALVVAIRGGYLYELDEATFAQERRWPVPDAYLGNVFTSVGGRVFVHRSDESRLYLLGDAGSTWVVYRFDP